MIEQLFIWLPIAILALVMGLVVTGFVLTAKEEIEDWRSGVNKEEGYISPMTAINSFQRHKKGSITQRKRYHERKKKD